MDQTAVLHSQISQFHVTDHLSNFLSNLLPDSHLASFPACRCRCHCYRHSSSLLRTCHLSELAEHFCCISRCRNAAQTLPMPRRSRTRSKTRTIPCCRALNGMQVVHLARKHDLTSTQSPGGGKHWSFLKEQIPKLHDMGITGLWVPPPTKGASQDSTGQYLAL